MPKDTSVTATKPRALIRVMTGLTAIGAAIFLALSVLTHTVGDPDAPMMRFMLANFGAIALSFRAGILWGAPLHRDAAGALPVMGAVSAILAWGAAVLGGTLALFCLAIAFATLYLFECVSFCGSQIPPWHFHLGLPATVVAIVSLLAGAV